ncbi:Activating signal cointegrator 1 complex subunit 1 [Lamellibrachia satsuma]|nr:Activating signal cointegrator 1 complex subunit 1 [Lamellibrachia satsuma]
MDVLRPAIIRIGSRCYRKNHIDGEDVTSYDDDYRTGFVEDDIYEDEDCDACTYVEETGDGFRGKKGETRRRIEEETGTHVRIPRQGEEGAVVVSGRDRRGVLSARTRISLLVDSARAKQPFTHFLSIPVNAPDIVDAFINFREDVQESCRGDRGIDGSIFQTPRKLHLTLGTLVLLTESDVAHAMEILQDFHTQIAQQYLKDSSLVASLRGLEYMNDDPSEVDILYGKVQLLDNSDRLQSLADALVSRFSASGLMPQQFDRVKLHVTLINSLFRKDPNDTAAPAGHHREPRRDRESFNATNVLKQYPEYDFGTQPIDTIHLSQRHSTGDNGYYTCTASIRL